MLTTCLLESRALNLCLLQPTLSEADPDILRVCTKLVITLVFKAAKKRILIGSPEESSRKMPAQLRDLYRRLGIDFNVEKA